MGYHIDLSKISLESFKERLENQYLLPSQKILEDNIDTSFESLKACGLCTMADLQDTLKSKIKLSRFSKESTLSVDYLTILRREVNSYLPKFKNLDEFPEVNLESVEKLKLKKIKNTYHLFNLVITKEDRYALAEKTGIDYDEIMEFTRFTDLSRIKWVGPIFAKLLILTGYDSVEKVTKANAEVLYKELENMNEEKKYYRGRFGLNDVRLLVKISKDVPLDIIY